MINWLLFIDILVINLFDVVIEIENYVIFLCDMYFLNCIFIKLYNLRNFRLGMGRI